jgi:hypothetical protein
VHRERENHNAAEFLELMKTIFYYGGNTRK